MPTDIFPVVDIPVVTVVWSFSGISPDDMEKHVITVTERAFTTTVNDIEDMESQSMYGVGVIKVFFHPGVRIETAIAQLRDRVIVAPPASLQEGAVVRVVTPTPGGGASGS
jgi:multidrug efflux pump subunit AcrB